MCCRPGQALAEAPGTTDEEKSARADLLAVISKKQKQNLPKIRDAYGPILRQLLWEDDITAKTVGDGFRTVELVGALFAANRNIQTAQETIHETLLKLRFTQARYRWYREADEFTYYKLEPPKDGDVVIWSGTGYRLVK